jgi:hypothetical protein
MDFHDVMMLHRLTEAGLPSRCRKHIGVAAVRSFWKERGLSPRPAVAPLSEQRPHVLGDDSRESSHRAEGNVLVAGFDKRDILLRQAHPFSHLGLGQTGLDPGLPQVLAEERTQIVGNRFIALGRLPPRTAAHPCPPCDFGRAVYLA